MRQRTCAIITLILATAVAIPNPARAQVPRIEVLWWTYAHPSSGYRTGITNLASFVSTIPDSSGLAWHLTFFEPGSPTPNFADYDVLVIESGEAFRTGPVGGPLATPNYSGILDNAVAIEAARGDRTFISGTDADFHAVRGDTGNIPDADGGICSPALSAPECWDGALGHLVNAINWAGSGNGLGIVSLVAADFTGSHWWLNPNSFLRNELAGYVTIFGTGNYENTVAIPAAATAFPVNEGLTGLGLSSWDQTGHAGFSHDIPGYTPIVDATVHPNTAVAIATSATADGATLGPDVPDLDADGRPDAADNCTAAPNGPLIRDAGGHSQLDTDGDGYGNRCDADLNNSGGAVNFADLALFRAAFGTANANADLNGSGVVNFADLAIFRSLFGRAPGPSGLNP